MKKIYILLICNIFSVFLAKAEGIKDSLIIGKLENGLTYYLRHQVPEERHNNRANFYIVQNVGALMEEDSQNGLAHFLEHMAFNGTEHFKNEGIVQFLKRKGIKSFNAYTAKNETVYHVDNVLLENKMLDSCLLILKDWSHFISLKPEEIEAERGVIEEEWRTRQTWKSEITKQIHPFLYNNSKYAQRDVIGSLDVIRNFKHKEIKDYYNTWYRPDLQGLIVVGDINPNQVEVKIRKMFAEIPKPVNPKERIFYEIPENDSILYNKIIHEKSTTPGVILTYRTSYSEPQDIKEYFRNQIVSAFVNVILSQRYSKLSKDNYNTLLYSGASYKKLVKGYKKFEIITSFQKGKDKEGLNISYKEFEKFLRYGATERELNNFKKYANKNIENQKKKNFNYINMFKNNFLEKSPIYTFEQMIDLQKEIIDELTLAEIKTWVNNYIPKKNLSIIISGDKPDYKYLSKSEIIDIISEISTSDIQNDNEDKNTITNLIDFHYSYDNNIKEKKLKKFDAYKFTLANGVEVIYKYVKNKKHQFQFSATSLGGMSVLKKEDLPSASMLNSVLRSSGIYKYDFNTLKNFLSDRECKIGFSLGSTQENIYGQSNKKDLESLFQLIYLLFEHPRFDKKEFEKQISIQTNKIKNKVDDPYKKIYKDVAGKIYYNPDPPMEMNMDFIEKIDFEKIEKIYKDRVCDIKNFKFYMVGDVPVDSIRPLLARYIGSINTVNRKEKIGKSKKKSKFILDEDKKLSYDVDDNFGKAKITVEYYNRFKNKKYSGLYAGILTRVLTERYMKKIREEKGGTYGVTVKPKYSYDPKCNYISIKFQCDKNREEELKPIVYNEVSDIIENGITQEEFDIQLNSMRKNFRKTTLEEKLKERSKYEDKPSFWIKILNVYYSSGKDIYEIKDKKSKYEEFLDKVNKKDIDKYAKRTLGKSTLLEVVIKSI